MEGETIPLTETVKFPSFPPKHDTGDISGDGTKTPTYKIIKWKK